MDLLLHLLVSIGVIKEWHVLYLNEIYIYIYYTLLMESMKLVYFSYPTASMRSFSTRSNSTTV
jgi:hypothetical protein